jgi:hypothetical protein
LVAGGKTELKQTACRYERQVGSIVLDLAVGSLLSPRLEIGVGTVVVAGHVHLESAKLSVHDKHGRLEAPTARFAGLSVTIGGINLGTPQLEAKDLVVAWGDGFQLSAKELRSNSLDFTARGTQARAKAVYAATLQVRDTDWSIGGLAAETAHVELNLKTAPTEVAAEPLHNRAPTSEPPAKALDEYTPNKPSFEWRIFDNISGQLNVDLGVDLKLPIIQRRQAMHEFRVKLSHGLLNFRDLESNLSTLEDALLDFSVRDNELVLELGIPLLPTRGHGKRLLRWPLSSEEQEFAARNLARLSTLANPQFGRSSSDANSEPPEVAEVDAGAFELRRLTLRNLNAALSLERPSTPMDALLRSLRIGSMSLAGELAYHGDDQVERTELEAQLQEVEIDLDDLPLTGRRFDLKSVSIESVPKLKVAFRNTSPTDLSLELVRLAANRVDFGLFAKDQ